MTDEQKELEREKYFTFIYVKARNSRGQLLKQNQANRALIEDSHMPLELFLEAVKQDKFASQFLWQDLPADKKDSKILEQDLRTLAQAALTNRNFGASEANLSLARSVLGAGFSESDLIDAYRTRRVVLTAPTAEERQHWQELDEDAQKLRWMNATTPQLKQEVRDGYADRRAQAAQAEADRAFAAKQESETGVSYPPLPDHLPEFLAKRFGNQRWTETSLSRRQTGTPTDFSTRNSALSR